MDINAAKKPYNSNVGVFQLAAPIPSAMGNNENNVAFDGKADIPSNNNVNKTVINGIPHLLVYVNEIPIRSNAIEFE